MKDYFTAISYKGEEQVFNAKELNLKQNHEYSEKEILEALYQEGYNVEDIEIK